MNQSLPPVYGQQYLRLAWPLPASLWEGVGLLLIRTADLRRYTPILVIGMLLMGWVGVTQVQAQSPGGVSSGLQTWLKADAITGTGNGAGLQTWPSSVGGYSVAQVTASQRPKYYSSTATHLVNFNPSVVFDRTVASVMTNTTANALGYSAASTVTPYHFIAVGKDRETVFTRAEQGQYNLRALLGNGASGDNPAMDLQKDGASFNGWNPWTSVTGEWNGGKATLYNGGGTGNGTLNLPANYTTQLTNQQPQIFGLGYTYGTGNVVHSTVDGWSEPTPLKEDGRADYIRASYFSVGVSGGGEYWHGPINEILTYNRELTAAELQKVNSYLAIKYGVTLGQGSGAVGQNANSAAYPTSSAGTGYNYILSDGLTTVWNTATNAGYNFDIAAIGQDNGSGLVQKQSQSVNQGFQPVLSIGTVAVSNAANTGTFAADKNFEAWGSNGQAASYATAYLPSVYVSPVPSAFKLMSRIWKVQETGTVGTITISVPAGSKAEVLLVSNSATFTTGSATEITLTPDGSGNLTAQVNLSDGQYFTFGATVRAPGGVTSKLTFWLDATTGTNTTANNVSVDSWLDRISSVSAVQSTASLKPEFKTNSGAFNFNPSLSFNPDARLQANLSPVAPWGFNDGSIYVMYRTEAGSSWKNLVDFGLTNTDSNNPQLGMTASNKIGSWMDGGGGQDDSPFAVVLNETHMAGYDWKYNTGGNIYYHFDGKVAQSTSFAQKIGTSNTTSDIGNFLNIGGDPQLGEYMKGQIAEVVAYQEQHTPTLRQRVHTYLALKYGITLDPTNNYPTITEGDYVASDGITIPWSYSLNSAYHNRVTGIGRDEAQGLNQKQSKSSRAGSIMTIGLGTALAATNAVNANAFATDKSFEIVGDNGLPYSYSTVYAPTSFTPAGGAGFFRMAATWKVQETGTVGTVVIGVASSSGADYLLVSNSPTFPSGGTQELILTPDGNGNLVATVDLTNGQFFTFGSAEKAPGGILAGLRMWLKADALNGNDGTGVATWQSSLLSTPFSVSQATAAQQPTLGSSTTALVNFNQTVNFKRGAAQDLVNGSQNLLSGNTPSFHFITVGKDIDPATVGSPYFGSGNIRATLGNGLSSNNPAMDMFKDLGTATGFRPYSSDDAWWGGGRETIYNNGGTNKLTSQATHSAAVQARIANQQPQIFGIGFTWGGPSTAGALSTSFMNAWVDGYKEVTDVNHRNSYLVPATAALTVGSSGGEFWNGAISEVINYTRELTDAEMQKVNTYLAIKYGTTLGQGGPVTTAVGSNVNNYNYVATDGTVIWNTATNSGYNFDIAGIGLDNFEGLNQKQSRSVNAGFQPALGLGTVDVSNDANGGTFAADRSYMVWGSNGSSSDYAVSYTPHSFTVAAPVYLMNRIWKVQETQTVGVVTVSIPGSSTGTYLLVGAAPGSFTGNTATEYALVSDGAGNLVAQVDLANGQYFTFGRAQFAPGCVATPQLWLKADEGVTVSGTLVSAWSNAGDVAFDMTQTAASDQPDFVANAMNFNPGLDFKASQVLRNATIGNSIFPNGNEPSTIVAVSTNRNAGAAWQTLVSFGGPYDYPSFHWYGDNLDLYVDGYGDSRNTDNLPTNTPTIGYTRVSNTTARHFDIGYNGLTKQQSFTAAGAFTFPAGGNGLLTIGSETTAGTEPLNGLFTEAIVYNRILSDNELMRVQSYLGLKYGVTLTNNYLSSTGATIYNVSSYSANVTGIGREDCQQLNQKQAKSVNSGAKLSIGLSGTIAATNATNPGSFTGNGAYLILGDNGLTGTTSFSSTTTACPLPPLVDKYTNLAYKVTETNSVSAVFIQFDAAGYGFNPVYPLYMQVFSDAAFVNLVESVPMSFSGSVATTMYDFPANTTFYVRFAGNTTSLANICAAPQTQTFHWNGWNYGTKTKTLVGNFGLNNTLTNPVMSVSITDGTSDPNVLLYKPTVNWWPVFDGLGIFIPRYDNNTASQQNSVVTTQMSFFSQSALGVASTSAVAAQTVDFVLRDIDGFVGGKDVVKVYGKLGAAIVYPRITRNRSYPFWDYSALTINQATGTITAGFYPWDLTVLGDAYVSFDSPVEQVFVEYTKQNQYGFKVYNDLRIGAVSVTCKAPTPRAPLADNVYVYKQATPTVQKTGEPVSYKFTIQNPTCDNKIINFQDALPGGLTWVDSTLTTSLAYTSLNAYGNTQGLTIGSLVVPPGMSYLYARVQGTTQGTYNNQATYTVQGGTGNTLLSDDPGQAGTVFQPTPLTLIQNDPDAQLTVKKTVNKVATAQNTTVTYSFTVSSANSASAVPATFQDVLPGELTFVPNSLSGLSSAYTSSTSVSAYGGASTLSMRGLSVPAGGAVSFSIQANVNSYTLGAVASNVATATPDVLSGFRVHTVNSNGVSTTIAVPVASCYVTSIDVARPATTFGGTTLIYNNGTLNGFDMFNSGRPKLENPANFGLGGTVPYSLSINDAFGNAPVTQAALAGQQVFYLGGITSSPYVSALSVEELRELYLWSLKGGTVIVAPQSYRYGQGSGTALLPVSVNVSNRWRFGLSSDQNITAANTPTTAGLASPIFNGPFGTVSSFLQDQDSHGNFYATPDKGSTILARSATNNATVSYDNFSNDIVLADVDILTRAYIPYRISQDGTITTNNDKLLGNIFAYGCQVSQTADFDGDGVLDIQDLDDDNDGLSDTQELDFAYTSPNLTIASNTLISPWDMDNDGLPNSRDLDSDGDGIPDNIEAQSTAGYTAPGNNTAVNASGLLLAYASSTTGLTPVDTDADGTPDYLELDTDGDELSDFAEAGKFTKNGRPTVSGTDAVTAGMADGPDTDGDGLVDSSDAAPNTYGPAGANVTNPATHFPDSNTVNDVDYREEADPDTDGDGLVNSVDTDDDNDGILDTVEGETDLDGDGRKNRLDLDSDNDGIPDVVEANGTDANRDGKNDSGGPLTPVNTDGDSKPDYLDSDSDGDGVEDFYESGIAYANRPVFVSTAVSDADRDGIMTPVDGATAVFGSANYLLPVDTDGDGKPDYRDLDADNDGINDARELMGNSSSDADGNGLSDSSSSGVMPVDFDGDGIPDFRDLDSDNDLVADMIEYGHTGYVDANNNAVVDGPDTDGDGIPDSRDGAPTTYGDSGDPLPVVTNEGNADYLNLDSDQNGIFDIVQKAGQGALDQNADGKVDNATDTDRDGIADVYDCAVGVFGCVGSPSRPTLTIAPPVAGPVTQPISGTSTPGALITITSPTGTTLCSTTANASSGVFSCSVTLPPGVSSLTITSCNPSGCSTTVVSATAVGQVSVGVKVFLGGAYVEADGLMRDALRTTLVGGTPVLPLTEPYSSTTYAGYVHQAGGGGETTTSAVLSVTGNNAIVDWVFIELHDPASLSTVVATRAALVQRDGDVVATDGVSPVSLSAAAGNYHVAVRHRNHLGTMTLNPLTLTYTATVVDFTSLTATWGVYAQKVLPSGVRLLWAGDADGTRRVKYVAPSADLSRILNEVLNFPANTGGIYNYSQAFGYFGGDVNLDGRVKYIVPGADVSVVLSELLGYPGNTGQLYNYAQMLEQIPR